MTGSLRSSGSRETDMPPPPVPLPPQVDRAIAADGAAPASTSSTSSVTAREDRVGQMQTPTRDLDLKEEDARGPQVEKARDSDVTQDEALPEVHSTGLVDQTAYLGWRAILVVFAALQLVVLLAFLDQTIVSTALPTISAYFNAGSVSSFVGSAYLITSTAFQPMWGRLSDIFGRKYTLIVCITIFLIGSIACAVAQSMTQLIVFRALKGVGGGGLLTLVLIIISDIVSLKDRGRYQGITEITIALANGVGPVLGGVISERTTWRWCFYLNIFVAVPAIAVVARFLPLKAVRGSTKKKLSQIDYGGAALSLVFTVLLLLSLNWGGVTYPWDSSIVIGCFVGAAVGFILFMAWELKLAKIPLIPPYIFRFRTVSCIFFNTFISGATILMQFYYIPQLLQIAFGYSAIRSGVLVIPLLVMTTFLVFVCGQLLARIGEYKVFIVLGYAIWCVGLGLLSTLDEQSSTARLVGYLLLTGAGQGQTLQTSMVAAQAAVERKDMAVVTSTRNFLRSLGGTVSLAAAAAVINNALQSRLRPIGFSSETITTIINDPLVLWRNEVELRALLGDATRGQVVDAYVAGFRTVFLIFVGLQGFNCLVALAFIKRISLQREDEEALKARGKAIMEARKEKRRAKHDGRHADDSHGSEKDPSEQV